MSDYKDTINLPKTSFSMKANLPNREPGMLESWGSLDVYNELRKRRKGCKKFVLHDGPPYANGKIHIGHALNKILKDIVVKSKILSGYDAPYIPGWDCHGLPIEHMVEKKHGKAGEKISPKSFRGKCREYAEGQVKLQSDSFKRLGIIADWEHPYLTMDTSYEAGIIRSFAKMVEQGHVQQGKKPVHWCIDCASALAEAEVEYKDKESPAIDVRFTVLDDEALLNCCHKGINHESFGKGAISIPIWTTTPWTLPANYAVAVNHDLEYVIVQFEINNHHERFIVADARLKDVMFRYGIENYRVVSYCRGEALEGLKLQHPFYEREVPIVLGDHVSTDTGTGAVHTAPGHGQDDFVIGMKYGLPIDNPVNDKGVFLDDTPIFGGEHVYKANNQIIELLKAHGTLIHNEMINHSYPHCWRHKTPLLFRATPQWFISMDHKGLRRDALELIFKVQWIPATGQARIASMVETRPDWCISRQRSWGVPIPLFVHKTTGELHPRTLHFMEEVAKLVEKDGIEAWFDLDKDVFLGHGSQDYCKVNDVLDVWFESGVSHACVLMQEPELQFPADLYLEGSDQHRGWFQSSLLTSVAMQKDVPYKGVLTHGFTVDSKGHKMSKSLGNVVDPEKIANTLGADILRLWIASADYRAEVSVSEEILKRIADTYRRMRNTARYLIANLYDFDPAKHRVEGNAMLALDRWAVDRARLLQEQLKNDFDEYQFHLIYQKIHHFCSIELGAFYLDIIKDRQYTTQKESLARRSAQTAMYYILEGLVRWFAPILTFTADEIWNLLPGEREESVLFATWYEYGISIPKEDPFGQPFWEQIIEIRDAVNKELEQKRIAGSIGSSLDAQVTLYCSSALEAILSKLGDELRFVFITSEAKVMAMADATELSIDTSMEGLKLEVTPSAHEKCARCWQRREEIGQNSEHPTICNRCIDNVIGSGEKRLFA